MSSTTCAPGLRRCCTTRPITRRPPPCALPSLPRPSAPKPPGASRPPASPTTACRCTASKACLPTSPPMRGSRRPPCSTTNTSSRSTPGQLRSSSAPSSSSPSTRIVPSKATRARDKRQRAHCLIDSKEGSSASIFLRSARRPNPGRGSTYRRGIFVQTTGTSSVDHYVDLSEGSDGLFRRYLHLLDIRYIQLENLDVVICGQLAFLFRRPHGSRDVPASLCEMERRHFTQAATGAGNEYRLGHVISFSCLLLLH